MTRVIVAIVGSRCLAGNAEAEVAVAGIIRSYPEATFCSGGAEGVDRMVEAQCTLQGRDCQVFSPHSGRLAAAARRHDRWKVFKDRNRELVAFCTHLHRVYCPGSPTFGSGWTYDYARAQGRHLGPPLQVYCQAHRP
jgi:hypothetical protein